MLAEEVQNKVQVLCLYCNAYWQILINNKFNNGY